MKDISRRSFLGSMAVLASAVMTPNLVLADTRKGPRTVFSWRSQFPSVLDAIKSTIDKWGKEGQAFKDDKLEPDNEVEWTRLLTSYFNIERYRCTSVNAANLCPSLKYVDDMVCWIQRVLDSDISFPLRGKLAEASLNYGLDAIINWIGLKSSAGSPQCLVALTRNTTEGNNIINNGLIASGFFDPEIHNIVVWDKNHPTNYDAWEYRRATQGWKKGSIKTIKTKMFSQRTSKEEKQQGVIPSDPQTKDDIIEPFKNIIDKHTRVVSISWQSNECGMLLPMADIVDYIRSKERKYGHSIHIHADSAQTFGVLDLQLDKIGVDSITGSFHKWPCGPKMVGIFYMNMANAAAERFVPNNWGYDEYIKTPNDYGYDTYKGAINPNAKRFSYLGQQNDATLVAAWITALFHTGQFHPNISPKVIEKRIHYLGKQTQNALYKNLPRIFPDFTPDTAYKYIATPTTNKHDKFRSSIFLFKVPNKRSGEKISPGDVMKHVYEQHGYAIANLCGLLRISPTINNTSNDVHDVVEATVEVIDKMQREKLANNTHLRSYA
jgi:selenocysteine lyase/cysteine desulfurase